MRTILGGVVAVFALGTVAAAAEPHKREQPAKPAKAVKLTKSELAKITAGWQPPGQRGNSTSNSNNNNNNNNNTINNDNNPPATAP